MKHHNEKLHALSRRLDPLWWLIARTLRLPRGYSGAPRSILVVDLHLLGDMVMLIPLLRVIRRRHSGAHVALMAGPWAHTILGATGLVDEYIPLRAPWVSRGQGVAGWLGVVRALCASRGRTWDWGIDVRGDVRNALLICLARARRRIAYDFSGGASLLTDVVPDDGRLRHIIDHHAVLAAYLDMPMTAEERVPSLGSWTPTTRADAEQRVGFHFGASMLLRRMPLDEAVALLQSFQHCKQTRLILIDAAELLDFNSALLNKLPRELAANVQRWAGSLAEFIAFLKTLDRLFAMDSGPAHLAAALGVDTTVFFGPHVPLAVRPTGPRVHIVERNDVPCRPCDQHRCVNPIRQECLRNVTRLVTSRHDSTAAPMRRALSSLDQ